MIKVKISTGWTAIPMAKGQHPLEEISIAIDLVVLLNVIKAPRSINHFGTLCTVGGMSRVEFELWPSIISLEINRP